MTLTAKQGPPQRRGRGRTQTEQVSRAELAERRSYIVSPLRRYHTESDVNFIDRVIAAFNLGRTVILDLGSLDPQTVVFLSDFLARRLWDDRNERFVSEGDRLPQGVILVEEAHNLLNRKQAEKDTIFVRIAKEGRKFGLGLLYVTQQPSSISPEILSQTENFFVMHVSSLDDVKALKNAKIAFDGAVSDVLLTEPVVGLAKVYSEPFQPFVLECQVDEFKPPAEQPAAP